MFAHDYLIIGGGMTADAATRGIRQTDPGGSIGILSSEPHPPYNRPPLSKALWKGEPEESVWRNTPTDHVVLYQGVTANEIDKERKRVVDNSGSTYSYRKLLLATGSSVRRLPWGLEEIIYFRTLDDYRTLRTLAGRGERFVVVGGGFIGSEIAAALAMNKKKVTMIFPEEGIGGKTYPPALSRFLNSYYQARDVEIMAKDGVANIERHNGRLRVRTSQGREILADGVVAGIGVQPNVELAIRAGLTVTNGISVDEVLRTSNPDIFAAGDVANFHNPALGKRIRVEHEDNAVTMGDRAGRNMAGDPRPYDHLPFFYSDLFDLGYEAVGELDGRLEIVQEWKTEFREGVIYYLGEHRVRGVLLWNTWGKVAAARELIAQPGPFEERTVRGRIS